MRWPRETPPSILPPGDGAWQRLVSNELVRVGDREKTANPLSLTLEVGVKPAHGGFLAGTQA